MCDRHVELIAAAALVVALSAACPPGEAGTPTCAAYCASITDQCTGGSAQYVSEADCVAFCDASSLAWGVGTADEAGANANTLGCRQFHAGAAANDAHCLHAGPNGGGVCGALCDVYCDAAIANCTGADELYDSSATCQASCAIFPANGNDADGDSVQCRIFHLGAVNGDPATHCSHGGASGANVCGSWCDVYCDTMEVTCPDGYSDAATCNSACGAFPDTGNVDDQIGDSVQCRIFHAGAAANDVHCDYANADSTADTCQ